MKYPGDKWEGFDEMCRIKSLTMAIVILVFTFLGAVCGAASPAAAENTDHKALVVKAYEKLLALDSYHMTLMTAGAISVQGNSMDIVINGECDAQTKPMVLKNVMTITMSNAFKKNEQKVTQYIEESKNQFVVYSNVNGQWEKQFMPYYNPLDDYVNYSKAIAQVTPLGETAESLIFSVTMDGRYMQKNIERALSSTGMNKMNLPKNLFDNLGDFTYTVTIAKRTATISKIDMDMSGFLMTIGDNIAKLKDIPPEQKLLVKEIFTNAKIATSVVFSDFNHVNKIVVPREIKSTSLPTKFI